MTLAMRTGVMVMISFGVVAPVLAQTANAIHYVYDELGRLIAATDPTGDTVIYTYDEVGGINGLGASRLSREHDCEERAGGGDCHTDAGQPTLARQVLPAFGGEIVTQILCRDRSESIWPSGTRRQHMYSARRGDVVQPIGKRAVRVC
jgi:YD repeat-containing protein